MLIIFLQRFLFDPSKTTIHLNSILNPSHLADLSQWFPSSISFQQCVHASIGTFKIFAFVRIPIAVFVTKFNPGPLASCDSMRRPRS